MPPHINSNAARPPVTGRLSLRLSLEAISPWRTFIALRQEKALLHTFVAGQKYGVGRDATRRFGFVESDSKPAVCVLLGALLYLLAQTK